MRHICTLQDVTERVINNDKPGQLSTKSGIVTLVDNFSGHVFCLKDLNLQILDKALLWCRFIESILLSSASWFLSFLYYFSVVVLWIIVWCSVLFCCYLFSHYYEFVLGRCCAACLVRVCCCRLRSVLSTRFVWVWTAPTALRSAVFRPSTVDCRCRRCRYEPSLRWRSNSEMRRRRLPAAATTRPCRLLLKTRLREFDLRNYCHRRL